LIEEKVNGQKIGIIRDYPITLTSIGCLFLFRVVSPREMSPVTWGFEKAKSKWLDKYPLSQVVTNQKVQFYNQRRDNMSKCTCPEQRKKKIYIFASTLVG
jgi:hypothetical protein